MITFIIGDLLQANVEAIVNPVNTVGIMGKGLAKDIKLKYFFKYQRFLSWNF